MIDDKELYRVKRAELSSKKDELSESIDMVDAVMEMMKTYNVRRLSALKAKLEQDYDAVADEYEEFTKEETETFTKITKEFSANQIECWFAQGYDMVDLVNAYLRGDLEKFKEKPNEHDSFAEIISISELVGQREVKLSLRLVSFGRTAKYSVITAETEFPWWMSKKNADDELTVNMVIDKMKKTQTREELVELARKTLKQSLQVMEDMGISKEEVLR